MLEKWKKSGIENAHKLRHGLDFGIRTCMGKHTKPWKLILIVAMRNLLEQFQK